jgi:hypothetical protein
MLAHGKPPPAMVTIDMDEAKRSIRKLAALEPATLCPGHCKPYIGGAAPVPRAFAGSV